MATVKLSKQISDKIRELNALGTFLAEIRLGAVARKLSELPVEKALECLQSVVDQAEMGEEEVQNNPTQAVIKVGWGCVDWRGIALSQPPTNSEKLRQPKARRTRQRKSRIKR